MASKKVVVGVLAGAVAGVAAGALLGLLFAPKKGSETRGEIQTRGKEYANVVRDKFNELLDGIIEKFEKGKSEATELTQKVKTKVEDEFNGVPGQFS